ncbi:MAG: ferritin [Eubacteriales bacterium]|nr:ferritin [Eubacteriales bacterium]
MLHTDITSLLNEQINKELYSAYLYLDIANYYADQGLIGFENWFTIQAQEERDHAMLIRTYLLDNDHRITLPAIDSPGDGNYENFQRPLDLTLEHEQFVTASIHNIYAAAHREKDFRTMQFLDWFVKEQGEEEKNATDLIRKFELFAGDSKGLYLLDQELGTRVYAAPSLVL